MDMFALSSHQKAAKAMEKGVFKSQILPIEVPVGKGKVETIASDESVRAGLTMEKLQKLKPVFKADGLVTAGNACPWSDGAAALVITSDSRAKDLGLRAMATIKSFAVAGVDPKFMGIGPVHAVPKALKRAGISLADIDWIELNEAFAAQAIPCIRELKLDEEKVNPYGGGIALGHPLGATGAILITKAVHAMQEKNLTHALITMCIGGGQGAAMVIEREL
jgi:acetyl-CoA C-acetyltransferase